MSMEGDGSNHVIPDFDNLRIEKGRDLDIEDLEDDGWRAASEQKKIIEIGSLGEGAGGAVTRCKLVGGKTEFALKVISRSHKGNGRAHYPIDHHHRPKPRCEETDCPRIGIQQRLYFGTYMSVLRGFYGRL